MGKGEVTGEEDGVGGCLEEVLARKDLVYLQLLVNSYYYCNLMSEKLSLRLQHTFFLLSVVRH